MPAGGRAPKAKKGRGNTGGRGYPSVSTRGRGASVRSQVESLEDTSSVGTSGDDDDKEQDASDDEDSEGRTVAPRRTHLCMWEFGQNDPKVDSGSRLTRMGIAKSLRPQAPFHGIVLSTMSNVPVSPADRDLILTAGLAGINCSWNRIEEIPWNRLRRQGQHRILPFLVAANSINYGRPHKLNTAEAMAAALLIAGLEAEADAVLGAFSWGDEFLRLNSEVFEGYRAARDASGVRTFEADYFARVRAEAQDRRDVGMDLPSSESGSEEDAVSEAAEGDEIAGAGTAPEDAVEAADSTDAIDARAALATTNPQAVEAADGADGGKVVGSADLSDAAKFADNTDSGPLVDGGAQGAHADEVADSTEALKGGGSEAAAAADGDECADATEDAKATEVAAVLPLRPGNPSADAWEQNQVNSLESSSAEAPALDPVIPVNAAVPREQKATLAAMQSVASPKFLQSAGLAGLSGNALAKLKRSEFESIWRRFCTEEAPGLSAEQAAVLLSPAAARQQKTGRAARK